MRQKEISTPGQEVGERPWGRYTVLEEGIGYKVKRIEVKPGQRLSLQSHQNRAEVWTVVQGTGCITLEKTDHILRPGQNITIPREARHRASNHTTDTFIFIEVQTGTYLGEDDIVRYEDDYNRS